MTITRRIPFFTAVGLALTIAVVGCREKSDAAKTQPAAAALPPVVYERTPYDPQLAAKTVALWQSRVRYDPQSAIDYRELAAAYLALQRESGDIAHVLSAEKAARHSLKILPRGNDSALYRLSRSLLTQHRFAEALQVINRASPAESDAQRLRADIFLELGDYKAADRALALSPPDPIDPNYNSLRARVLEIEGQPERAQQCLHAASTQAAANWDAAPETIAWHYGREARGLANQGRIAPAKALLQKALAIFPHDYRAMVALTNLNANQHDWAQAIQWGQRAAAIVPEPATIALLGDAFAARGNRKAAQQQFQLVETMSRLARAQGVIYDRQRALFYADHNRNLPEALRIARGELKSRHDIYSYDTLAWVCYRNGRFDEAQAASRRALAFGTQDAMLWYHAGLIARAKGDKSAAARDLKRALSINPYFHPTAPQQIRALLPTLGTSS